MEDDLEEELLAVAGRSRGGSKKRGRKAAESSDEDYDMEEQQKPRKKKAAQAKGRADSDEDGELGSASDFDDGYDSDLMGDEEDRARLEAMTELDREMELAERSERRDEIKERRQTAKVLRQQQRSAAKASNMRSSTRQKGTDVAKKSAMAELVAAKKAQARKSSKGAQKRRGRRDEDEEEEVSDESEYEVSERSEKEASPEEEEEDAPSSVDYSRDRDRDRRREEAYSDEEEDDDDGVMTRQFHGEEESEDAEYKHIKNIQVRRFMLEKWQNEPFFERSLPGAVVRIAVGSNRYFLAQIVHVEERPPGSYKDPGLFRVQSPYEFPEKGPKTNKWLYVQRGTSPRLMPMHLVSNHGVTPEEFDSWRGQCEKDNRPQITTAEVDEVKERLNKAHTYVYTTADVTRMVEEKRARGEVGNVAKEKARLVVKRAKALEDGDHEQAEALQAQITEMEQRANLKAQRERELRGAGDAEKGKKSLAEVNKLNALKNMENALKNVTSRPEGSRTLTSDGIDPFSRRPTRPMTYWKTKKDDDPSEAPKEAEPVVEEDVEMEDPDPDAPTATATENASGGIDLNIDLSALQKSPEAALLSNRLLGPHWAARLPTRQDFAGRKTLTLADYKRRQGIV